MTHNFMAANNNGAGHLSAPWWKSACSFSEGEEGSAFPEYQQTLVVEADSGAWAALPHVGARPAAPGQRSRSPEELRCAAYAAAARRRFLFGSSPCLPALSRHGNQNEAHPPPQFLISSSLKKADLIPLSSWKWPQQHHWNQYDGAAGVYNSNFYIPNSLTPSVTNQSWWGAEDGADMMDTSSPVPTSHGVFIFHAAADQQQHPPPLVSTVFPAYSSSWENKLGIQNYCYLQQGPLHCSQGGSTLPANFICCLHQPTYLQNQYPYSSPSPYSISHNNSQQQQLSSIEQNGSYLAYEHQFGAVACNNPLLQTHFSDITQQHQQSSASLLMGEHNKDAYVRRGSFEGADILCYKVAAVSQQSQELKKKWRLTINDQEEGTIAPSFHGSTLYGLHQNPQEASMLKPSPPSSHQIHHDKMCTEGKQQQAIITMKEVQIESILVGNMQEGGNGSSSCALNTQPLVDTTSSAEEGAEGAEGEEGSCQQMHLEPRQLPSASEFSTRQKYHQDVKCRNVQRHQQQIPILFPATGGSSHKENKKRMCILEKHCTDDSANFDGTKHFLSRSVAPCHCTGTGMPHSLDSLKRRATSTQITGQSQRPVHYRVEMTHSGPFSSKLACALAMVEPLASSAAAFATWHRGAKQLWVAPRARAGANSLHFEQQQQKSSC